MWQSRADVLGDVAVLRAEEELFLQLGMAKRAEFLRDPMLFAVGSGIRGLGGSDDVTHAGTRSGRKAAIASTGDGEDPEDGESIPKQAFS